MSKFDLTLQNSLLAELFQAKQIQVRALSDELEACHKLLGEDKYLPGENLSVRISDLLDDQNRASSVLALSHQNVDKLEATIARLEKSLRDRDRVIEDTFTAFESVGIISGSLTERVKKLSWCQISPDDNALQTLLDEAGINKGDNLLSRIKELIHQRNLLKKELEELSFIGRERDSLQVALAEVRRHRDRLQADLDQALYKKYSETRRNEEKKTVMGGPKGHTQIGTVWEEINGSWTAQSVMLGLSIEGLKDEKTARAILQGVDGRYSDPIKLILVQDEDGSIPLTELQKVYHHGLSHHFRQLVHNRIPLLIEGYESSEVIQKWVLGGQELMDIQFSFEEQGDE